METLLPQIEALFDLLSGCVSLNDPSTAKLEKENLSKGERLGKKFSVPDEGYDHYFSNYSLFEKNELGTTPHIQYAMATLNYIHDQLSIEDRIQLTTIKASRFTTIDTEHRSNALPTPVHALKSHHTPDGDEFTERYSEDLYSVYPSEPETKPDLPTELEPEDLYSCYPTTITDCENTQPEYWQFPQPHSEKKRPLGYPLIHAHVSPPPLNQRTQVQSRKKLPAKIVTH